MTELVCAWCDVYSRVEREQRDEQGRLVVSDTCCAYCGRGELRFGKLGRQTPLPDEPNVVCGPWGDAPDLPF